MGVAAASGHLMFSRPVWGDRDDLDWGRTKIKLRAIGSAANPPWTEAPRRIGANPLKRTEENAMAFQPVSTGLRYEPWD
jgi:hypothetical protein